jgi:hypothetical protein
MTRSTKWKPSLANVGIVHRDANIRSNGLAGAAELGNVKMLSKT